jgi:methylamine dehydrogenase light chain
VKNPFDLLAGWFDRAAERQARQAAQRISRRSILATLGQVMVGALAVPLLPFDRSGEAHGAERAEPKKGEFKNTTDDEACDYWRYCALSGTLCTCCGGSVTSCPPGSEVSKVTWVGTCENPTDGKHYLVSYNDCCGKMACGQCPCSNHLRERPGYRMGLHNGINWCMANDRNAYHCTVAALVGLADKPK